MKNQKYMMFADRKVKWRMFKLDVENFFKVLFRRKTRESKVAKETLQSILDKNNYLSISDYLKEAGFYRLEDHEPQPTYDDMEKYGVVLAVANKNIHLMEAELVLYADVKGFEDRYLITYIIINCSKGFPNGYFQGYFCDRTHKTQKETVELKNLIKRLTLVQQHN